jgi:hypothetical protein
MSYDAGTTMAHDSGRHRRTSETVSGFLAACAIFVSFLGIWWHPLRLILPSLLLALVAAGMARGRLQLAAVLICAVCLFFGFALAVATSHALW